MNEELKDELDAIEAIYPECLTRVNNEELIDLVVPQHEEYKIRISFPAEYPNEMPHILQVRSKNAGEDVHYLEGLFNEVLESVFVEGSVCLFDFLTELDGVLYVEEETEVVSHSEVDSPGAGETDVDAFKGWTVSEPIVDRNSTFIAFAQRVESESEMNEKLSLLKMNKKISRATHNMTAFRIANADGTKVQDCDDDGETAAGGRLLHLLTVSGSCFVGNMVY